MEWVLIIIVLNMNGVGVGSVEFNTHGACIDARLKIIERIEQQYNTTSVTVCVEKGNKED